MPSSDPARASTGPSTGRRRELVATAKRLFLARGFAQTSVSAIVREAGVAQGTFYLYFKSKQSVLPYLRAEVLGHYLQAFEESTADTLAPADERLVAALIRIHAVMREQVPLIRVFREATSSEEIEQIWLEGRETLSRPFAQLIAAGRSDGSFVVDDDRMAAHLALALLDDLLFEALVWQRPAPPAQTLIHATRFLLRGLGSDSTRVEALCPMPTPTTLPDPIPDPIPEEQPA
ncbi:TetR/AcrR family transcriptional regulator [Enhygromyxa salina]|uniref:Fatty acid metabolism regulator protein n=1 Tax=Enhygromyxa salina TaxID=215803 RepID=A0A2S9YXG9_9BACT|nr:TetR/AcrR family transcriptional regulator [Enhygromyxa salina]PRQ09793.1 Fatty acid metabolism regulator protein [Enhygromyxa salina]